MSNDQLSLQKASPLEQRELDYESLGLLLRSLASEKEKISAEEMSALMKRIADASAKQNVCLEMKPGDRTLLKKLKEAGLACYFDQTDASRNVPFPFIIDNSEKTTRLYLHRRFYEEKRLAQCLSNSLKGKEGEISKEAEAFLSSVPRLSEEQRGAVRKTLKKNLAVISGGPGTGKTSIVAVILECLLKDNPDLRILLAAPTGKAAARLKDALTGDDSFASQNPDLFQNVYRRKDEFESKTIHRWLANKQENGKRPDSQNPLEGDVLIVDEASMIDSQIAARFFAAVDGRKTKIIILGDKHQLSAVGPGAIFAVISDSAGPLKDSLSLLTESFRFGKDTAIGRLANAVNAPFKDDSEGREDHFAKVRSEIERQRKEGHKGEQFFEWEEEKAEEKAELTPSAEKWLNEKMERWAQAVSQNLVGEDEPDEERLKEAWRTASSFGILAAVREGGDSVNAVNAFCESFMRGRFSIPAPDEFYSGKLIIVRKNDNGLGVANGDVGFIYKTLKGGKIQDMVYFGESGKKVRASLLPQFDTAFSITIHQSQGSGYKDVAVFLPRMKEDAEEASLATRELVYTGITRAKKSCTVFGSEESLRMSCTTITKRAGGLTERLKEAIGKLL